MAKRVKNPDMFDVDQFRCWMFPCYQHDLVNETFFAEQVRKKFETIERQKLEKTESK